MSRPLLIDSEHWQKTRSGARAGRGFRYQDAVAAWLAALAWRGEAAWTLLVPEGVDDLTMHGPESEFRVQLKSRHDPQSLFTQIEAAKYLAKSAKDLPQGWRETSRLRLALVLERPLEGIQPTGWTISLAGSGQQLTNFEKLLTDAIGKPEEGLVEALMGRTHLVVEPEPLECGCISLSSTSLPPAGVRLVLQQLREQAGHAADANYKAPASAPATLDRSDVQARIDQVHGIIDPAGYVALTAGLTEVADFSTGLSADAFYRGVNVAPGHVGAGLVFDRPELMGEVLAGLEAKRFVLVAGPSGSGKSALAWLAAHCTRHSVRWYRVRELSVGDVGRLVQLTRLLEASPERPVGFVVDDVGRQETSGWDALVREAEQHAGLLAIGTVREEDVLLLSTATRTPTVRPKLDEELASRVWKALQTSGPVRFSHWQEPFELSHGLLLEYTHLLTAGKRLEETIREQVRRRLVEDRGDELVLLRTVSFAAAHGAAVDPTRLRLLTGLTEPQFAKALHRLIDEHAVRARPDGALIGLHEIRSTYLDKAVSEILGDPRSRAIADAAATLVPEAFAGFIVRVFRQWPEEEAAVMEGLAPRLSPDEAQCWAPIFHGLGLATADRVAQKWLEISRAAEIEDRLSGTVFILVLANSELGNDEMFSRVKVAQTAFAEVDVPDLRTSLVALVGDSLQAPALDILGLHELTAAMLPIAGCKPPPHIYSHTQGDLAAASLEDLLALLTTLREVGLEPAKAFISVIGGTEAVLDRIFREMSWVTKPVLGETDGVSCVMGYIRHVHPEVQPDLNTEVVRLCEAMAAAVPHAEIIVSDALFADGKPFGYGGHTPNTKRIPRRALPAPARVAWNRAQLRAVHRLVAAPTETQRTKELADAVSDLGARLREAGDFYCRMEIPGPKWKLFLHVRNLLTTFVQPPSVDESVPGPLAMGKLNESDKLHNFVTGLQQLMGELTDGISKEPALMAARTADLARDAEALLQPDVWRMTSEPPLETLMQMRDSLWEVRAVLGDAATDPERWRRAAIRLGASSRRHSALRRAAEEARERAEASLAARREEIRIAMAAQGLDVEVFSRPSPKDNGFQWPNAEFAVLLNADHLIDWFKTEETFAAAVASLADPPIISYGVLIGGQLAPFGMIFLQSVLPSTTFADEWAENLPFTRVMDEDLRLYDEALDAIGTMSIIGAKSGRELNDRELEFFTILQERSKFNIQRLSAKFEENPHEVLGEAIDMLVRAFERLSAEIEEPNGGALATDLLSSLVPGPMNDLTFEIFCTRIALIERAALPAGS